MHIRKRFDAWTPAIAVWSLVWPESKTTNERNRPTDDSPAATGGLEPAQTCPCGAFALPLRSPVTKQPVAVPRRHRQRQPEPGSRGVWSGTRARQRRWLATSLSSGALAPAATERSATRRASDAGRPSGHVCVSIMCCSHDQYTPN